MKKFVPDQIGAGLKKKDETSIISLIYRLARAGDFDEDGRIRGPDGSFMEGTNVAQLCSLAFRPEPHVTGVSEFAILLRKIGIDAVPNENLSLRIDPFAAGIRDSVRPQRLSVQREEPSATPAEPRDVDRGSPLPQDVPLPPDSPLPQDVPLPPDSVPQKRKAGFNSAGPVSKRGRKPATTRRSSRLVPPPSPPLESVPLPKSVPQKRAATWLAYQPPEKRQALQKAVRRSERKKKT